MIPRRASRGGPSLFVEADFERSPISPRKRRRGSQLKPPGRLTPQRQVEKYEAATAKVTETYEATTAKVGETRGSRAESITDDRPRCLGARRAAAGRPVPSGSGRDVNGPASRYETTTTYVNETVVEPVVKLSKDSLEYTKCKTEETKTFAYDTTMTAYENLKALFETYTLALGSRKEAPTVDDVPVASV